MLLPRVLTQRSGGAEFPWPTAESARPAAAIGPFVERSWNRHDARPRTENGGRHCCQPPLRRASRSSAFPLPCGVVRARPFVSAWLDAFPTTGGRSSLSLPPSFASPAAHGRFRSPKPRRRLRSASPALRAFRSPLRAFGRLFRSAVSGGCFLRRFRLRCRSRPHPKALMNPRVVRAEKRPSGLWITRITGISFDERHSPKAAREIVRLGRRPEP